MTKQSYWQQFGKQLAERDGMTCHYCGVEVVEYWHWVEELQFRNGGESGMQELTAEQKTWLNRHAATVDHVIPRSQGGSDDLDNLVIACRPCNTGRGAGRSKWKQATVTDKGRWDG